MTHRPHQLLFQESLPAHRAAAPEYGPLLRRRVPCVGDQLYPPGSFRDWHTDRFGYAGWVVFLVEVAGPGRSSFRYVDPRTGEMVVVPDRNDTAYFFRPSLEFTIPNPHDRQSCLKDGPGVHPPGRMMHRNIGICHE